MKSNSTSLKWTSTIICFVILLQSCQVYHSKPSSTEEAIESDRRVKIVQTNGKTYKFDRIDHEDGEIFGFTKKYSKTAKKLKSQIISKDKRVVKIKLDENLIKKIRLQNKLMSTLLTIGGLVVWVTVVTVIVASVDAVVSGDIYEF